MKFISTGYGTFVQVDLVETGSPPHSSPTKRLRKEAEKKGNLVNLTEGHKVRTVLRMINGDIVLCASEPDTILQRLNGTSRRKKKEEENLEDLAHARDFLAG